jgi:XTP/dITP diphosphohydrolase
LKSAGTLLCQVQYQAKTLKCRLSTWLQWLTPADGTRTNFPNRKRGHGSVMNQFTLVLGTHNRKKRRELEYLLVPLGIELKTLEDFPNAVEVEETGDSFHANAALKATVQARHLGQWVLGEDSGLQVDALNGAPGIYSARFAGLGATDEANNRLLLEKLADLPPKQRRAWYHCHFTLSDPEGNERINCFGRCFGRILNQSRGQSGFGYDPLFEIPEYHQTFAELGDAVKSVLSHRARANREFVPQLFSLIETL